MSHQFPVEVVVTVAVEATVETVEVVEVMAVEVIAVGVEVVAGRVEVVDVLDVVEDEQDANASEVAMRKVINTPIILFFISSPILFYSFRNQSK